MWIRLTSVLVDARANAANMNGRAIPGAYRQFFILLSILFHPIG